MLESVSIKNLACFDDMQEYTIHFAPLTVITGPNNSGKSTILHAINYTKLKLLNVNPWGNSLLFPYDTPSDGIYAHELNRKLTIKSSLSNGARIEVFDGSAANQANSVTAPGVPDMESYLRSSVLYLHPHRVRLPKQASVTRQPHNQMISPNGDDILQFYNNRYAARDGRYAIAKSTSRK